MDFVETTVYGVTVSLWLTFLVFAVLVVGLVYVLKRRLARRLRGLSPETSPRVTGLAADVLHHFKLPIVILIAVYLSAFFLALPAHVMDVLRPVAVVALIVQLTIWANLGIGFWFTLSAEEKRQKDAASVTAYGVIGFLVRLVLWSLAALFVLGNLGIDVTALVAGLGIGGVAIALAVQNILGDVFCSISIVLDKPFEVGDFIVVDDQLGVVEKIGIKTTRLRSLFGEQIVFSNADLLRSRIRNYKHMRERRVVFSFGVVYQTPADRLEAIPGMVKEIVESQELTRFDRAHFSKYGPSSLDFEVVYYVGVGDYNRYMDIQQAINLALFRRFEREGISFAYPTQTLYIARETDA